MENYYRTKAGDTLDAICWQYYVKEINLGSAAMAVDPRLLAETSMLDSGFLLNAESDQHVNGAVEMVLQANLGLAAYPLTLPAGLNILLPEMEQNRADSDEVKLWD